MTTRNLQATLLWCLPYVNSMPLTIAGNDPALSNANLIMQTILGAPFCWRWNRAELTINAVVNQQDYVKAVPDFGFIEKVWWQSADGTDIKECEVRNTQALTKEQGRPNWVSAQSDDGAGNITFRLSNRANETGIVTVQYQKKAPALTSLASLWAPIPDELAYIFDYGFLALAQMLNDDPRYPISNQRFTSHLLGAQDGLDEMQRNIFLGNWLDITKQVQRAQGKAQQGLAARQQ